jgi:hypothetical protein
VVSLRCGKGGGWPAQPDARDPREVRLAESAKEAGGAPGGGRGYLCLYLGGKQNTSRSAIDHRPTSVEVHPEGQRGPGGAGWVLRALPALPLRAQGPGPTREGSEGHFFGALALALAFGVWRWRLAFGGPRPLLLLCVVCWCCPPPATRPYKLAGAPAWG